MNILQIVNPVMPIPPKAAGGIERIVYALCMELLQLGHHVTLLAQDDSKLPSDIRFHPIGRYAEYQKTLKAVWKFMVQEGKSYDVIHNHGRLIYFLPRLWGHAAKVETFHGGELVVQNLKRWASLHPTHFTYVPCGDWITQKFGSLGGRWKTVHNGLPKDLYTANMTLADDAPLLIMARLGPAKGFSAAIRIARATGRRLWIAGRIGDYPHEKKWFEESVLKHCDGQQISYIGEIDDVQKQKFISQSAAVLLPVEASEAFTVVMIEALACGTPVVGYNRYCLPELIQEGYNGFLANDEADMIEKVKRLPELNRRNCRKDFEERFTSRRMAEDYVRIYEEG